MFLAEDVAVGFVGVFYGVGGAGDGGDKVGAVGEVGVGEGSGGAFDFIEAACGVVVALDCIFDGAATPTLLFLSVP